MSKEVTQIVLSTVVYIICTMVYFVVIYDIHLCKNDESNNNKMYKKSYMKYLSEDDIKEVPRHIVSNSGHAPFTSQACSNLIKDNLRIFQR